MDSLCIKCSHNAGPPPAGSILVPFIGGMLSNDLLHIVAPIMAVLDWLLFDVHGKLQWRYALCWLLYPLVYLAFVLIRGLFVTGPFSYPYLHYPYPFLNVDKIGYRGVVLNTVIYGVAFWVIGIVFVGVDRAIGRFYVSENGEEGIYSPALPPPGRCVCLPHCLQEMRMCISWRQCGKHTPLRHRSKSV